MKPSFRAKGKKVVKRVGIVLGVVTVICVSGSLIMVGAAITGLAEHFGRSPMKPPE